MTSAMSGLGDGSPRSEVALASAIVMPVSATTRSSVARTSSAFWVGTMRQFTFAVAVCGSAL